MNGVFTSLSEVMIWETPLSCICSISVVVLPGLLYEVITLALYESLPCWPLTNALAPICFVPTEARTVPL